MLRMRLQRRGKTGYATFRVIVADQRAPVKGRSVADLGSYNPHSDAFTVNQEKVQMWLSRGVQPSATVHNLLVTHGLLTADKVTSWKPKKKEGDKEAATEKPAAEKTAAPEAAEASVAPPVEKPTVEEPKEEK